MSEPATPGSTRRSASLDPPNLEGLDGAAEDDAVSKSSKRTKGRGKQAKVRPPPKQPTPKKERFTSNRSKASRQVRKPRGSLGKSYIKVYEYKAKCVAYCGFKDITNFRTSVLSLYVITFYNMLHLVVSLACRANTL